MAHNNNSNHI